MEAEGGKEIAGQKKRRRGRRRRRRRRTGKYEVKENENRHTRQGKCVKTKENHMT